MWINFKLYVKNNIEFTNWLASIQFILEICKQLIIFFILIVISKILRLQVYYIITISSTKMKIFCNKNLVILKIVHPIFVVIFIFKMNILMEFIIQLLTTFIWYMYRDSTSKITTVSLISSSFTKMNKFGACVLIDQALIQQIYY